MVLWSRQVIRQELGSHSPAKEGSVVWWRKPMLQCHGPELTVCATLAKPLALSYLVCQLSGLKRAICDASLCPQGRGEESKRAHVCHENGRGLPGVGTHESQDRRRVRSGGRQDQHKLGCMKCHEETCFLLRKECEGGGRETDCVG